jgi:hypothetical protein
MAIQLSTAARNNRADSIETTLGASAILKIRSGPPPANADAADTGNVLSTIALPADYFANSANGQKALSGSWIDGNGVDMSGFGGHFRFYRNDGVTCDIQGLVSEAWQASKVYALNQQVHNGGNVYRCTTAGTSAASGGPTGTGAGITDGSAVWSYVGTADMSLDNTNLNAGQQFSITAFTLNEANG